MRSARAHLYLICLLLAAVAFAGCNGVVEESGTQETAPAQTAECDTVTDIEGEWTCTGECVVTDPKTGARSVITIPGGETDTISKYQGAENALYQVEIHGGDPAQPFHEIEIGALTERTLRTATAEVSDNVFPVLEEYVFETDDACRAVSFTKIVRGLDRANFKACAVDCVR